MRKILLYFALLLATPLASWAITPREAFVTAPHKVFATIDSLTRLDMLDYYDSGSSIPSRNNLGGNSSVKLANDTMLTVSTSGSSETTICLLPSGSDTTLLVIKTMALPAADSEVSMYRSNWTPLPPKAMLPSHNDLDLWLLPQAKKDRASIENLVPFVPAIYSYSDGKLTVSHTLSRLLSTDDYGKIKSSLRPAITYQWQGNKWKKLP